jgi:hypothetical protein
MAGAAGAADVAPFEINMDRVKIVHDDDFGDSKTYVIPTVYLHVTARVQTEVKNEGASAKAKVYVTGLDKAMLQGLARQVQDDLVGKIRAAGFTVLTYDDIKAEVAGFSRMEPNKKYGFPVKMFDKGPGIDFAIVSPTDEQTFDYNFATGPTWPWKDIAKGKNTVVLLPQVYFNLPEIVTGKGSSIWGKSVSLNFNPVMKLYGATVYGLPPGLGWCSIAIQEHGKRLAAEGVGTISKGAQDTFNFGEWSQTTGDFGFAIEPAAVSAGILRVGYAINDLTVKTIKDAH